MYQDPVLCPAELYCCDKFNTRTCTVYTVLYMYAIEILLYHNAILRRGWPCCEDIGLSMCTWERMGPWIMTMKCLRGSTVGVNVRSLNCVFSGCLGVMRRICRRKRTEGKRERGKGRLQTTNSQITDHRTQKNGQPGANHAH